MTIPTQPFLQRKAAQHSNHNEGSIPDPYINELPPELHILPAKATYKTKAPERSAASEMKNAGTPIKVSFGASFPCRNTNEKHVFPRKGVFDF